MRGYIPRTQNPPKITLREKTINTCAPLRQGENGERSASLPEDYTTLATACQQFFKFFSKIFHSAKNLLSPRFFYLFFEHSAPPTVSEFNNDILSLSKMHNLVRHVFRKILTHGFSNEKFYKKSSKLNIYKSLLVRYNISAVGGTNTTASRTTAIVFDKVSIL